MILSRNNICKKLYCKFLYFTTSIISTFEMQYHFCERLLWLRSLLSIYKVHDPPIKQNHQLNEGIERNMRRLNQQYNIK